MLLISAIQSLNLTRSTTLKIDQGRVTKHVSSITPFLRNKKRILDLGCGFCSISNELIGMGYDVTPVDIRNSSMFPHIKPLIYDGDKLPFTDKYFDSAIIVTVLHHTPDPGKILKEVKRVSREIVIIEDTYTSDVQKYLTHAMDCIVNAEFFGHPHTNKSDQEWEKAFKKINMKLLAKENSTYWKFFRSSLFHLSA